MFRLGILERRESKKGITVPGKVQDLTKNILTVAIPMKPINDKAVPLLSQSTVKQ